MSKYKNKMKKTWLTLTANHRPANCCRSKCLTHWGLVTHICVSKPTIIGSDNGLSPGRRQAIIWTNAGILLIRPLGTNFNEIFIKIQIFSFKKMHLKMSAAKWRPFCLGLNVLLAQLETTARGYLHRHAAGFLAPHVGGFLLDFFKHWQKI